MNQKSVILDTGMAIDDSLTLLYLAKASNLLAVTESGVGESQPLKGAQTAARLLAMAESTPTKIGAGTENSLSGNHRFPSYLGKIVGTMLFVSMPKIPAITPESAVELLAAQISHSPEKVTIVITGPATNVGMLVQQHPEALENIAEIVMMGGAVRVPGNSSDFGDKTLNPNVEWNVLVDPLATKLVIESGVHVKLVPLDATNGIILDQAMYAKLVTETNAPVAKFAASYLHRLTFMSKLSGKPLPLWDPAAATVAINPELAEFETMNISVIADEANPEFGRTIIDPSGHQIEVCVKIDADKFAAELSSKLS